ncbi:MAG: hypothetical protein GXY76_09765 [Chloroflexi bacterium]|nr:hypothetical protein [Chloroflexota bacterium]
MTLARLQWRDIAKLLEEYLRPDRFNRELQVFLDHGYREEDAETMLAGLLGHYVVEAAGLEAALGSPSHLAPDDLRDLAAFLSGLAIDPALADQLTPERRELYCKFVDHVCPVFARVGQAMASVLQAYVTGDYDLAQDPNQLLDEADRLAARDADRAKGLIAQVGAMCLRGRRVWWGWPYEVMTPVRSWLQTVVGFVESVTQDNTRALQNAFVERRRWTKEAEFLNLLRASLASGAVSLAQIQFRRPNEQMPTGIDELIFALFAGEDALTDQLIALFATFREQAIPHLIELMCDRRLWRADAIGGGWVPIHAVDVLGQLRATEAVEPLLRILIETDPEDILYDHILAALERIGQPALPCILDVMAFSRNSRFKLALAPVLGAVGRGSPAACDALEVLYLELDKNADPGLVVLGLIALQDKRTVPLLKAMLQDRRLSFIDRSEISEALAEIQDCAADA